MKIVHVVPSLAKGGAEKFVVDLCNEFSRSGNEVYIISLRRNEQQDPSSFLGNLDTKIHYFSLNKGLGFSAKALYILTRLLEDIRPKVVHSHLNAFEYLTLFKLKNRQVHYFHTVHSLAPRECSNPLLKRLRAWFFKKQNHFPVVISEECQRSFDEYYQTQKSFLIENGSNKPSTTGESFHYKGKNEALFVAVGRIEPVKNHVLLAEAVKWIKNNTQYSCKAILIGNPSDQEIVAQLNQYGPSVVEILGVKRNIGDYLLYADAFCLSSRHEGMPISLIEALAMGCIPVCTPVGGVPDVIQDGENGFLSEDLSVESYAKALLRLIECTPSQKETLQKRCMELFTTKYDIKYCAEKHLNLYNS